MDRYSERPITICTIVRPWLSLCDVARIQRPLRALVSFILQRKLRTNMRWTQLLGYLPQPVTYPVDQHSFFRGLEVLFIFLWYFCLLPSCKMQRTTNSEIRGEVATGQLQCWHLIPALNAWAWCLDDLTTDRCFYSQATCVINVLGLFFWTVIHGCLYNQALDDVRSTGAGIKF